jgi:low temperature requirement protein LtrA
MTSRGARSGDGSHLGAELRQEESVRPLELFFDLVFVLAFTQCTALMAADPTWAGIGRGMLVLAMVWWAWVGYAWLTSLVEPEEGLVRIAMFAVMAALLIVAFAIPEAFGDRALGFAIAYGAVRLGHIALFLLASRGIPGLRGSVVGLAVGTVIAIGLLVAASFLDGAAQAALWVIAILIDWGEPAVFGVDHWRLMPAHFAERHDLIIILALGESVVALGVGADLEFTTPVLFAAVLGIALASALWWIYFDVVAPVTERRLTKAAEGRERNALARDSYSYLHFPMAAGIVLGALGVEAVLAHTNEPLDTVHAFALLGGTAIYLLAHVALRLRNARSVNVERLVMAIVLLGLIAVAVNVDAIWSLLGVNVLLWAMISYETVYVYDERRYQLRHDMEVEIPGSS